MLLAIQGGDGRLGLVVVGHLDEAEALAAAGVPVVDDLGGNDLPVLTKQLFQLRAIDLVAQVPDIQLFRHWRALLNAHGVAAAR